jgi:hypothetical protein
LASKSECNKLRNGINAFMAGAILQSLICFADIVFCFLRARQIKNAEALYTGITNEESDPMQLEDDGLEQGQSLDDEDL